MAITYVGAWRAGMDAHYLWQNADWNSFTAKWNELSGQNLRLARITTFGDGAQRRWTGVWREGSGGHYLWAGVDWNGFTTKWNQLSAEGLRLDVHQRVLHRKHYRILTQCFGLDRAKWRVVVENVNAAAERCDD